MLPPVDARQQFGANLRALRRTAGLSQERLALDAQVEPAEISRMESGVRDPRMITLLRLAATLQVSLDELVVGPVSAEDQ